ncbi:hypothetical protein V6N13_131999 [Hibiscus sabdariffa]|uniref:Uncharacterized protein n=1 Tax=Hibiscus sabdariffa TaxID=183260 RepID=A0ABR2NIH2_9ROSI
MLQLALQDRKLLHHNKQENWTKALKYTLCNLKWALYRFIGSTNFQPLSGTVTSATEVPAPGSLYAKRGSDPKSEARKPSNSVHNVNIM